MKYKNEIGRVIENIIFSFNVGLSQPWFPCSLIIDLFLNLLSRTLRN